MKENDLIDRTFEFAVSIIKYLRTLGYTDELKVIKHQLIKAATSVGANYEEAQGASSKIDFAHKVKIVLKEAREANYWFRLLKALDYSGSTLDELLQESKELKNIFGAIVVKSTINRTA